MRRGKTRTLGATMPRTFYCPTCGKETHILRKRNPSVLLSILAALAAPVGAWPGSCPGCVRYVHVIGTVALITILVVGLIHVLPWN
jgi:hypothetical protein